MCLLGVYLSKNNKNRKNSSRKRSGSYHTGKTVRSDRHKSKGSAEHKIRSFKPAGLVEKHQKRHAKLRSWSGPSKEVEENARKEAKRAKEKENNRLKGDIYKKFVIPFIEKLGSNPDAIDYLTKNVGKASTDIISLLKKPRSDEEIAGILDMKINAVRRILNIIQGYGITNYNVSKNKDGWLSFTWYIDDRKAYQFFDYISERSNSTTDVVNNDCNDYFICSKCYRENRLILTFDAAYESGFKCVCDNNLSQMDRSEIESVIANNTHKNSR